MRVNHKLQIEFYWKNDCNFVKLKISEKFHKSKIIQKGTEGGHSYCNLE